jgi:hypothetical protein
MPDGIKEKGDRHHRGERGLGVAAARRVGRDGAKLANLQCSSRRTEVS